MGSTVSSYLCCLTLFQQSHRTNASQTFRFDSVIGLGDSRHCPCAFIALFFVCSFLVFVWVPFFFFLDLSEQLCIPVQNRTGYMSLHLLLGFSLQIKGEPS